LCWAGSFRSFDHLEFQFGVQPCVTLCDILSKLPFFSSLLRLYSLRRLSRQYAPSRSPEGPIFTAGYDTAWLSSFCQLDLVMITVYIIKPNTIQCGIGGMCGRAGVGCKCISVWSRLQKTWEFKR
jgi:hypothetical protein